MKALLLFALVSIALAQTTDQSANILHIIPTPNPNIQSSHVGEVDFQNKLGTFHIGIASPDTLTASHLWRLPAIEASGGGCVNSDGSYNLSIGGCGGANSTQVSPAHPMELYCHFTDSDKTHIRFDFSRDYVNYSSVHPGGYGPYTENRDTSCYDDGATIYIVSSPTPANPSRAQFWTTTDLVNISGPTTIDMTAVLAGTNADFAPEWFKDPNSSFFGVVQALSANYGTPGATFTPYLTAINPAALVTCTTTSAATCSGALGASTALTLNGTAQSLVFDFWMLYDAPSSKYKLFYVDEATTSTNFYQKIAYATSNTLNGTYTQVTPATTAASVDHFALSNTTEAPAVVPLANSLSLYGVADCYRTYADTWLNLYNSNNNDPRAYTWQYVDTCPASVGGDPFVNVMNAPIPVNVSTSEHGTVIVITNQNRANLVYKAQDYFRNGAISETRQRLGGSSNTFSIYDGLTLVKDPPNYFLGNIAPVSLALGGIDPNANAQPRSFAVLSWCGVNQYSCSPTLGGEGRFTNLFQSTQGGGQFQFGNSNIDTGETSLFLIQSPYAWGPIPLSASSLGQKGVWGFGINNRCNGPVPNCGNMANNWMFAYNAGLGPATNNTNLLTNPGFETGAVTPWIGGNGLESSIVHSGTYAEMLYTSGSTTYLYQAVTGLTSGATYTISGWAYGAVAVASLGANLYGGANVSCGNFTPGTQWVYTSCTVTADSTGGLNLVATNVGGAADLLWDDFSLTRQYVTNPGFETGDFTGWTNTDFTISTAQPHGGSYSAATPAGSTSSDYIVRTINGLIPNTIYQFSAWSYAAPGATCAALLGMDDGSGANFVQSPRITSAGEWYQVGAQYTADSTGSVRLLVYRYPQTGSSSCTGMIYFDDIQFYPQLAPTGAFPFGISPSSGEVHHTYGTTYGIGDQTATTTLSAGNFDCYGFGFCEVGDGQIGHHNANLRLGSVTLGTGAADGLYSGTTQLISGSNWVGGSAVETRQLDVQRIEVGYSNVPGVTSYTLPASGTATIFSDSSGPGNITRIQLAMANASDSTMLNTRLKVTVDGTLVMNVDLGTFYLMHGSAGGSSGGNLYAQLFANDDRAFTFWGENFGFGAMRRIFIPYTASCVIQLVNADTSTPQLFSQVDFYDGAVPMAIYGANRRVFHSVTTEISNTVAQYASVDFLPLVTLAAGQTGVMGGIDQVMYKTGTGLQPSWLEGDPTFTGDSIVSAYGGSEDFFGSQFYAQQIAPANPDMGFAHMGPAYGITLTSMYRNFRDAAPFNSTAKYTWYNGASGQGPTPPGTVNAGAFVYWYSNN